MNAFLSRADRIVATSDIYATSSEVLRSHAGKLSVIPIGIDTRAIPPVDAARQAAWRSRTGENFFLFVGVLRYYKALQVLIEAVAGTELRVVIAGDGPEGSRLRALAQQLGAHNVLFAGRIPDEDKWTLLSLARGFVLPSDQRSEAYGVALLEAMAAGLPLVTAEIGTGVNFVNRTDVTGLTVPRDDATALREALRRLAADAELCRRLGAAGKLRTGAELGAQRMVDGYLRLYNQLLGD